MTPRSIAYAIAIAALLGLLWLVNSWRIDSNKLEAAETELTQLKANYAEETRLRTEQDRISTEKATSYETQLADAHKTNAELAGKREPIRVCHNAPSMPRVATAAAEPATATGQGLQQEAGPDIGPALYGLALEADECSVRLSNLQDWIKEQLLVH